MQNNTIVIDHWNKFPDGWDKTIEAQVRYYNKCRDYVDSEDDMENLFRISIFYRIYCLILFSISIVSAFYGIKYRNKVKIIKSNIVLIIFYSFGCIVCTINSYFIQVEYKEYPCVAYFYLTGIGYPIILITSFGCIINYLKHCYYSVYIYEKAINSDNNKNRRRSLLHRICEVYTQSRLLNFLLSFVIFQLLYSLVVSYVSDNYSLVYIKKGFCGFSKEYLPQIVLVCIFLFVSFPLTVYQFYRLHDNFKFINTLMINLLIMTISAGLFIAAMAVPDYNCSQIVRFLPSDAYALIISCSFHYSQVIRPLLDYYYMNKKANKLEININGLIQLLNDDALFNEFFEYCKQKCYVEHALFHIKYKKFKGLINLFYKKSRYESSIPETYLARLSRSINRLGSTDGSSGNNEFYEHKLRDKKKDRYTTSSNTDLNNEHKITKENRSSDLDYYTMKEERKKAIVYSDIHKLANDIYANFLNDNSKYEINIPEKTIKEIKMKLLSHNQKYKTDSNVQLNDDRIDIENIFDDAYDEVLQVLFVDVYTEFITNRNEENQNKKQNNNYKFYKESTSSFTENQSKYYSSNNIPSEENFYGENSDK